MRYADIKCNDIVDGEGVCVSLWAQGCPHRCKGCHNPETWAFQGGFEFTEDTMGYVLDAISENGIRRNFSILGGEPLCPENVEGIAEVITKVRNKYPDIKVFVWTGYTLSELTARTDAATLKILSNIDFLIDGRYDEFKRDITLKLRGSSNQHIYKRADENRYTLVE